MNDMETQRLNNIIYFLKEQNALKDIDDLNGKYQQKYVSSKLLTDIKHFEKIGIIDHLPKGALNFYGLTYEAKNEIDSLPTQFQENPYDFFLNKYEAKKQTEKEKERFDFLTKKWIYKTRLLPYFLSIIAIVISTCSYLNSKKQPQKQSEQSQILQQPTNDTSHKVQHP